MQQLVALALISSVPLVASAFYIYKRLAANERETIRQSLYVSARTLASLVDNELATHNAVASTLALSPHLEHEDLPAFWREASEALKLTPGAWLALSDPDGQQLVNTLSQPGTPLPRHRVPEIIQKAFAEKRSQVSDLVFGPVAQRWTVFIEVPVFKDGRPHYSISIAMLPERFLHLLQESFKRGEVVAILDRAGKFVARMPDHEERVGTLASVPWRQAIARSPSGWTENRTLEGTLVINAYAETAHGWTAGVAVPEAQVAAPLNDILSAAILLATALTLLSLGVAAIIARSMGDSMKALTAAARDLGEEQDVTNPRVSFLEGETIARALVDASSELKRRQSLISQNQANLEEKVEQRTSQLREEIRKREATELTLRQSQKMDSIGQLTGGIAHDFNNMLTIIMGNLDTAMRRLKTIENSAVLNRPLESAMQGARNAAKLTHRLLAFARQQPLEPATLYLDRLISGMADLLTRTTGEAIMLETVSSAGLWPTYADPNQVENCLVNLAINARDAMPDGGKLTIETANTYLDEVYASQFMGIKPGQSVMLSVSDTGSGMPADVLEKVFEPFFSTKEPGKGTGLGLAMVHGFVRQSDGHIRIYSEVGAGTTVKIYLPRQPSESIGKLLPADGLVPAAPEVGAKTGETVLLVEDDAAVREYATSALEDLGYGVLAAASGTEAMKMFETALRVDVLFTDVVLGGEMSGRQLADRLWTLKPDLLVIFTTGYTRNAIVHHGRLDPGVNLINKPYTQRELAERFRKVIDSQGGSIRRLSRDVARPDVAAPRC
jgi:signal transduction histidine kinase/CheY-like chemotaxis protein